MLRSPDNLTAVSKISAKEATSCEMLRTGRLRATGTTTTTTPSHHLFGTDMDIGTAWLPCLSMLYGIQ